MSAPDPRDRSFIEVNMADLARQAVEQGDGPVVLVHEAEVVGFFGSALDAIREGYRRFGREPFYVRDVVGENVPVMASNFTIS